MAHDLLFFEKRSTPKVVTRGKKFTAPESYGKQTRRRPATAEEEKVIARGDWLRVDQSGKKGGQPGYKKTKMKGREHLVRNKSALDLRDELMAKYGTPAAAHVTASTSVDTPKVDLERAFVVHAESGRTVITAPVREVAATNAGFLYLHGRLVGADTPNGNGALWSSADLELGQATVAGGPLNWLHDDAKIIGCLMDGSFHERDREAADDVGPHIKSNAAVWKFLFQKEARTIEEAASDGQLYYSMECISRQVACVDAPGRPGCGEVFGYGDYDAGRCCAHLRERSSIRRFVDPIFLGAAVIVPPVQPGWSQASASVVKEAAALAEQASLDDGDLSQNQARDLAAAVLSWANR